MNEKSEWRVSGPEHYEGAEWYTVEEWRGDYFQNSAVRVKLGVPSRSDEGGEPIWDKEQEMAHFIAQALNTRDEVAALQPHQRDEEMK